jgi:hypothetical protein
MPPRKPKAGTSQTPQQTTFIEPPPQVKNSDIPDVDEAAILRNVTQKSLFSVRVEAMHERNTVIVDALSHTGAPPFPTCSFIASRIQVCLVVWWFARDFVAPPGHLPYQPALPHPSEDAARIVHPQGNANVHRTLRAFCRREIAEQLLPGIRQTPLGVRCGRARGGRRGARAVGRSVTGGRWARFLIHLLPARRFRLTPFLPLVEARLSRLSFVMGDRANRLPAEIQARLLGDERPQVGRLVGVASQDIVEHARRGGDTCPQVMRNANFEGMHLLGIANKRSGIALKQVVIEGIDLGPEALILPLAFPSGGGRLARGYHNLAPSFMRFHRDRLAGHHLRRC